MAKRRRGNRPIEGERGRNRVRKTTDYQATQLGVSRGCGGKRSFVPLSSRALLMQFNTSELGHCEKKVFSNGDVTSWDWTDYKVLSHMSLCCSEGIFIYSIRLNNDKDRGFFKEQEHQF